VENDEVSLTDSGDNLICAQIGARISLAFFDKFADTI